MVADADMPIIHVQHPKQLMDIGVQQNIQPVIMIFITDTYIARMPLKRC